MSTRHVGKISSWKDEKGFGYITPHGGGPRVFFHITALTDPSHRPEGQEVVSYELSEDERGRTRAEKVDYVGIRVNPIQNLTIPPFALILPLVFVASILLLFNARKELPGLLTLIGITSLLSFLFYGIDKSRAENDAWRISENSLHMLAVIGGWPGALLAQYVFRHKVRKGNFLALFWMTVIFCEVVILILWWFNRLQS